jgi:PEP-CTERM motif
VIHRGEGNVGRRRRRTRRHRRNRLIRRGLLTVVLAVFAAGVSSLALRYFSPSLFRASQSVGQSLQRGDENRSRLFSDAIVSPSSTSRPVYPYSVVPGGVQDAKELKWFAEHDPVVAAHYAGFDYAHARVVRLELAKTVYVSYRIGNHIYWTRHRISLHKGEKLISDGKMTARTRCANRVEELPKEATAPAEPPVAKFEEPVHSGTAVQSPPVPFQSALLNRPFLPAIEPGAPISSLYNPFVGETLPSIAVPPLPRGAVCSPTAPKKKTGASAAGLDPFDASSTTKKKNLNPCGTETETVPEPGTWLMVASGLAGMYWQVRRKLTQV